MAKLELFYPVKPLRVNQAFGIANPSYIRFGFTKHNGIDYATEKGQIAYAMCDGIVIETGKNDGAGNYVKYATELPVEAEGHTSYVVFMYMHAEQVLVKKGQKVKAGDALIVTDTTGFSTGNHLHISAFFGNAIYTKQKFGDAKSDYCFDFSPYYNTFYATDAQKVFAILYRIIDLLVSWRQNS